MDTFIFLGGAWLIGSIAVGVVAEMRGRMAPPWFLISMAVSPVLGAILLIALPVKGRKASATVPEVSAEQTRCTECREVIRRDARKCKHCGSDQIPQT